jgi:hypothetical protein
VTLAGEQGKTLGDVVIGAVALEGLAVEPESEKAWDALPAMVRLGELWIHRLGCATRRPSTEEAAMAVGTIDRLSEGIGAQQYDAVIEKVGMADKPVEGMIFHSAGELEGSFQVFNVWEARENYERFKADRLRPAMVAIMGEDAVAALPGVETIYVDIHNYVIA